MHLKSIFNEFLKGLFGGILVSVQVKNDNLLYFNFAIESKNCFSWYFNFEDFRSQPRNRENFML